MCKCHDASRISIRFLQQHWRRRLSWPVRMTGLQHPEQQRLCLTNWVQMRCGGSRGSRCSALCLSPPSTATRYPQGTQTGHNLGPIWDTLWGPNAFGRGICKGPKWDIPYHVGPRRFPLYCRILGLA